MVGSVNPQTGEVLYSGWKKDRNLPTDARLSFLGDDIWFTFTVKNSAGTNIASKTLNSDTFMDDDYDRFDYAIIRLNPDQAMDDDDRDYDNIGPSEDSPREYILVYIRITTNPFTGEIMRYTLTNNMSAYGWRYEMLIDAQIYDNDATSSKSRTHDDICANAYINPPDSSGQLQDCWMNPQYHCYYDTTGSYKSPAIRYAAIFSRAASQPV